MKYHFTVLLSVIFSLFVISCSDAGKKSNLKAAVMPDSSVNQMLNLRNAEFTPDSIKKAIDSNGIVLFTTYDELEFLIAHQFPDDPLGSFIGFEICRMRTEVADYPNRKINTRHFKTTNGIYLGMPEKDLLEVKGNKFEKNSANDITTYIFTEAPADFLQRHSSNVYIFDCEVVFGKVTRIRFGFLPETEETNSDRRLKKVNEP